MVSCHSIASTVGDAIWASKETLAFGVVEGSRVLGPSGIMTKGLGRGSFVKRESNKGELSTVFPIIQVGKPAVPTRYLAILNICCIILF